MGPINWLVDSLMLPVLEACYQLAGNYGLAIVLVTIMIKVILLPLTMQSYYSMKNMQIIQPKMKQIQERYKKKPEEMNKRIMQLYKENKVNPLGGCLPLLVQMPFLIALYAALMSEKFVKLLEVSGDPSFLFIPNLAKMGVYAEGQIDLTNLILVLLFGATTFWQQKVMQAGHQGGDSKAQSMQKQMMVMMPLMITVMFLVFPIPSGVFIYMIVSNFIGVAQYAYLNQKDVPTPKVAIAGGGNMDTNKLADKDSEAEETVSKITEKKSNKTKSQSGQNKKRRSGKKKHYRRNKKRKKS